MSRSLRKAADIQVPWCCWHSYWALLYWNLWSRQDCLYTHFLFPPRWSPGSKNNLHGWCCRRCICHGEFPHLNLRDGRFWFAFVTYSFTSVPMLPLLNQPPIKTWVEEVSRLLPWSISLLSVSVTQFTGRISLTFSSVYAFSWNGLPWVYASEIYPITIRGACMSITAATQWVFQFAIARATPYMILYLG